MAKDYTGSVFGDWTVIGPATYGDRLMCRCKCGLERDVLIRSLVRGKSTSCGKCRHNIVGQRFGRLTVLEQLGGKPSFCRCLCDCGNETTVQTGNIKSGGSSSCGCLRREVTGSLRRTHAASGSRTYRIWSAMKTRATNPNIKHARFYSERGIKCCQRWLDSYEAFLADMGEASKGMSIERIDTNGDYCPENCKWATVDEQMRNRRDNVWVTYKGERMVLADAERVAGLPPNCVRSRIRNGWPEDHWFDPYLGKGNHFWRGKLES